MKEISSKPKKKQAKGAKPERQPLPSSDDEAERIEPHDIASMLSDEQLSELVWKLANHKSPPKTE